MKHSMRILLALVLTLSMIVCTAPAFAETAQTTQDGSTPLVVGYDDFSGKFSPFFSDSGYDGDVKDMTQIKILTTDRSSGIVYNAIEGETHPYNGTDYLYTGPCDISVVYDEKTDITTYTAKLRDDITFSDGVPVTADDIIFSYYVYLDTSYAGSTTLSSYNIIGLQNYRTQTNDDVYAKYAEMATAIFAAGEDHVWAETDSWTQEQQEGFWAIQKQLWMDNVQAIVDYCLANYADYAKDYTGYTIDEVKADAGLQVAMGMALWNFGTYADGVLTANNSGKTWTLAESKPTLDDFYAECYAAYNGDADAYFATEAPDSKATPVTTGTKNTFIAEWGPKDPSIEGGIQNISGIKKLDDYTVEVKTQGFEAPAVYTILGIDIAPMHYYGDPAQYDYDNNKFGFPRGDVSIVASKTANPVGAGPYKFVKYENRVVYFEANENYYKGAPKTQYIQFKETNGNEMAAGVATGTVDAGELSGSKANFEEVAKYNSNGEVSGDKIATVKVDNLGYGYIGMNADTMLVGDDPASEQSKDLRKAFATLLAVYRDVAYDSYYGDAASVINYPISNTSWAAPQPTDEDYRLAFSADVDGNDIYTPEMTADEKYAAALEAAKGYFKAAGYTYDDATGKFTAAPEGASMSYEVLIGADGIGDHPSFAVLTDTKAALETIGIELKINDPADSNVMWDALDAGTQNMWCAAWQATPDPDMYQVYHSSGIVGRGGSDSNHYHIDDPTLDQLVVDARKSADQSYRKTVYKQCLDIILDWAVEIPAYQRQNCTIFSPERIDMSTVTPDITTYWGWMAEVEKIAMK